MDNITLSDNQIEDFINSKEFKWFKQELEVGLRLYQVTCETSFNRAKIYRAQGAIEYARYAMALPEIYLEEADAGLKEEVDPDDS